MIGGRVLDGSAVTAFATGRSVYAQALVWTAVEADIVLVIPSTAVAAAWAALPGPEAHAVLEALLDLHVTTTDDLTADRARAAGLREGPLQEAHALLCATDRGWPLVTAEPARYTGLTPPGVEVDALP